MGMFKTAIDAGVELARHLEDPQGAVKDNLDSQRWGGRIGGGLLGALLGSAVPAAAGANGAGLALGAGLGALGGGYLGGQLGEYAHKRELDRILRHPDTARQDADATLGWRGALMAAGLGTQGALLGGEMGGAGGALLGAGLGGATGLGYGMADQHHRRALIEELVGRQGGDAG